MRGACLAAHRPGYPRAMSIARARTLRRAMTDAEQVRWARLRDRQLAGAKFRRQFPIGPYVADFACQDSALVVELDGGQHTPEGDADRTAAIEVLGFRVIRFWNDEVLRNTAGVLEVIAAALSARRPRGKAPLTRPCGPPSPEGEG